MRVIEQLVAYLTRRGFLSQAQLEYLRKEGFLTSEGGDDGAGEIGPFRFDDLLLPDEPGFELQEEIEREGLRASRTAAGRKHTSLVRARRARESRDLCERLGELAQEWEAELEGLWQLARLLSPGATPARAPIVIRNAEPGALWAALVGGLGARQPSLALLWSALGFEGYRGVLEDPELPRPALRAYAALLGQAGDPAAASRSPLLKEDEVRWVINLIRAQWHVLATLGQYDDPRLTSTARWMRRDYHPTAYWALVLVYNARRADQTGWTGADRHVVQPATVDADQRWELDVDFGDDSELNGTELEGGVQPIGVGPRPGPTEHVPRRGLPDQAGWARAWAHALAMDPARVTPFFGKYFSERWHDELRRETLGLVCPKEWDR